MYVFLILGTFFSIFVLPTSCCNLFHSSPPNATYMHQWIASALVQIMACRLFCAKPLSKPMLCYINWTFRNKLQWNFNQNTSHFICENASQTSSAKWWPFCPGGDELCRDFHHCMLLTHMAMMDGCTVAMTMTWIWQWQWQRTVTYQYIIMMPENQTARVKVLLSKTATLNYMISLVWPSGIVVAKLQVKIHTILSLSA